MKKVIERLYSCSPVLNEHGQYAYCGRVGGCQVTGNEDGAEHCDAEGRGRSPGAPHAVSGSALPRSADGEVRAPGQGGIDQRSAQMEFSFWALKASREAVPPVA